MGFNLVGFLQENWPALTAAPGTFLFAVLIGSVAAFLFLRLIFNGQISTLRERLAQRDDLIAEYREKLQGATPEEARARIDRLEAQVNPLVHKMKEMEPRRLTAIQKTAIIAKLSKMRGAFLMLQREMQAHDTLELVEDFLATFHEAGWEGRINNRMSMDITAGTGLALCVNDPKALTPAEKCVAEALQSAGLPFDVRQEMEKSRPVHMAQLMVYRQRRASSIARSARPS